MKDDKKKMDFDDRETSEDLVFPNMTEDDIDKKLIEIYGEEQYKKLFG